MNSAVLDSSALLAYLLAEPGADKVKAHLGRAAISAVNLSEVVARLADKGPSEEEVKAQLAKLRLSILNFDEDLAYAAGMLRRGRRSSGFLSGIGHA